ncbi:YdcF family protein [Methylosinus sp. Ce-a6]|uniref:YdcF family protein n=1 Tax=Methylosinus sp. Ce-a6 TaxID=2172005 RepID=UPI001FCE35EC|nr:YdcF family protein [Methylosinus sp. Ce-a6]
MLLCCFLASAFVAGFIGFALSLERTESRLTVQADGVVVLTGGSDRVQEAGGLLARGQARRLLITGVNRATRGREIAKLLPVSRELFDCCVDLGYRARDTVGNALETRDWARARGIARGSLIVVTSNYHMPRALAELAAALPEAELYPFSVVSDHLRVEDWLDDAAVARLIAAEYVKYLFVLLRTRLLEPVTSAAALGAAARAEPGPRDAPKIPRARLPCGEKCARSVSSRPNPLEIVRRPTQCSSCARCCSTSLFTPI